MADAVKQKPPAEPSTTTSPKTPWWKSVIVRRWLAILIVGSLVVHSVVFILLRKTAARSQIRSEYTVGTFSFVTAADSRTVPGKFDLHIRFVDDLDLLARQRIATHQFRVRETVENLLRKAHGIELDDPAVARLKHQLQERIDEAIDLRAVAEVIITDLTIPPPTSAPPAVLTGY